MKNDKINLKELRPHFIRSLHEKAIEDYREEYKLINGKYPSGAEIDKFSNYLIGSGKITRQFDELSSEWENRTGFVRKTIHSVLPAAITISELSICLIYIFLYLQYRFKILLPISIQFAFSEVFLFTSIIVIISIVHSFFSKPSSN